MQTLEQTINDVHRQLEPAGIFLGHGSDNAWDEAVYLVLAALELPMDADNSLLSSMVTEEQNQRVQQWLQRRLVEREPLPYIMQRAYFMGLPFYVDERVLIPRSLLGVWLADYCQPWVEPDKVHAIVEIGTGSGCIAIAAALQFPDATVDAVDISGDALAVAQQNVDEYELQDRVSLHQSDCFDSLPVKPYDLILSNPPYVSDEDMAVVPEEYKHEPSLALRADDHGLAIVMKLLRQAPAYLSDHGVMMIEVGYSEATLKQRFPDAPFIWLDTDADDVSGLFVVTKADLLQFLAEQKVAK